MVSIMEVLVEKNHPEYTKEEVWEEVWRFCEENALKIRLFLKRYCFEAGTEALAELREQTMSAICSSTGREIQRMLCKITNFETGILLIVADEKTRERVLDNTSNRLKILFCGEMYVIVKKMILDETLYEMVLRKVLGAFYSEDM